MAARLIKQLEDITECPICTQVYNDPRVLPCIHTFCLKCIDEYCKDKQPGDQVACPLCRKEFVIPRAGVGELQKNFFIHKLLSLTQLPKSDSQAHLCQACSHEKSGKVDEINTATVYCLQCQEKLCESCAVSHRKFKASRSHKVVKLGEEISAGELSTTYPVAVCDKHPDESLKIYCIQCKTVICMMCYIEEHNSHKCSNVSSVVEEFRVQMSADVSSLASGREKIQMLTETVKQEKETFLSQINSCERTICETADRLKEIIEHHKQTLLNELLADKQKRLKEIENVSSNIEQCSGMMDGFKRYMEELLSKGTCCDIVRAACSLRDRTIELLEFDSIERQLADLGHTDVIFKPSNGLCDDARTTLGALVAVNVKQESQQTGKDPEPSTPRLTHVVPKGNPAFAVTSLGDDVFLVRKQVASVEVYDCLTMSLQRRIDVPGLGAQPFGLAACATNHCLYVSDFSKNTVHRVDLSDNGQITQWSVPGNPRGLSLNSSHNVLVACHSVNKLHECTTRGQLVREICLQGVTKPFQAVQLSSGQFVVSQHTSPGVVHLVGPDGQAIKELTEVTGRGTMGFTFGLAVTATGVIIVADYGKNKILAINQSLTCARELTLPVDGALNSPGGLHLDESRGRLYVSEWGGGRTFVWDNVTNINVDS